MTSAPRRVSSVLINDGANVFEVGVTFFEFDRYRDVTLLLGETSPASEELRLWEEAWVGDNCDVVIMDFGLPLEIGGPPGPGDSDLVLAKGFPRFC